MIPDNVRIPLMDDPRVKEALRLSSEKIALINRVLREEGDRRGDQPSPKDSGYNEVCNL
jgi:hypothetical protein